MSEQTLVKARLIELKQDLSSELSGGKKVDVQFNPESMKVTFANQIAEPKGGDQKAGTAGRQFVGAGTTKLALTLWF
ncbi:MAG: peptidoglycan-binding protein, partial [Allosphingosinicella sp.]